MNTALTDPPPEEPLGTRGTRAWPKIYRRPQVSRVAVGKVVGVIGGSGLYDRSIFGAGEERSVETPYGEPSDALTVVTMGDRTVAFLPRHGGDHSIAPHRLNHAANLWALRDAGASSVLATSSAGSLKPAIRPGTFVVPHDYLSPWAVPTIHAEGVTHMTPQLDPDLRKALVAAGRKAGTTVRARGVYVQALGPRLETRAEIAMFAKFGDLVGMTMASEATIALELGLRYASLCSVDNYAHGIGGRTVSFDGIRKMQARNAVRVREILRTALGGPG